MTKRDYTLYIYKTDRRYRSGERPISTTVWRDRTEAVMEAEIVNLREMYPSTLGYRFEYFPTKITVKSLMTGQDIEIDRDTPWACNPASETFWST
jgi:hypothetical protein